VDIPAVELHQPKSTEFFRRVRGLLEPPLEEERIRIARAAYFALCEHFDVQVGKLLDCLDASALARDTLVIYTSDHGDMAGEHGCWWKSHYYEASVGVPLVARLPGAVAAGAATEAVCNLMDLGPTMAEAAGVEGIPHSDGRSLWPALVGDPPADWPDETASELVDTRGGPPPIASRMIRSGKWKLWVFEGPEKTPPALFDMEEDPDEVSDLAGDRAFAGVRDDLLARVYADWDPGVAARETEELNRDLRTLSAWGKAVRPPCPDALPAPPPDAESDVVLL
jgi:choline-sulfatase